MLQNLELNSVKGGQPKLFWAVWRSRARRVAPGALRLARCAWRVRHRRRPRCGPCTDVEAHWLHAVRAGALDGTSPPSSPTPLAPHAARAQAVTRRPRHPTTGVATVPASRCRLSVPIPWPSRRLDVRAPPPHSDRLFKHCAVPSRVHQGRRWRHGCHWHGAPMPAPYPSRLAIHALPLGTVEGPTAAGCLGLTTGLLEQGSLRPPRPGTAEPLIGHCSDPSKPQESSPRGP
jgi:hypothetical protein